MDNFNLKYRSFQKLIENELKKIKLNSSPKTMNEPINYILSGSGKRIRPILTILSSMAVGGEKKIALPAAVAIEVLHNFTLVHDDIMDNAPSRRGRITLHKKWDTNVAILSGDAMVGIAYNSLLKSKSKRINECVKVFTSGLFEVCEGQALDKEFESKKVSLSEYFKMIDKKTAKMISIAVEIGAILGNGNKIEVDALKNFGLYLGRAFQIQDDLLDAIANEKDFGKQIGGDIKEGKRTFLLLTALKKGNLKEKALIKKAMEHNCKSKIEIEKIISLYKKLNVIEDAKKVVYQNILSAKKELKKLKRNDSIEMLDSMATKIAERVF